MLEQYQELLKQHLVVTVFLTMLVGAGGNAGNQSAIKVIRGLVGALTPQLLRNLLSIVICQKYYWLFVAHVHGKAVACNAW